MEALDKCAIVWPEEWKKNIVDLGASLTLTVKNWKQLKKISKADSRNYILDEKWGSFVKMNIFMFVDGVTDGLTLFIVW